MELQDDLICGDVKYKDKSIFKRNKDIYCYVLNLSTVNVGNTDSMSDLIFVTLS